MGERDKWTTFIEVANFSVRPKIATTVFWWQGVLRHKLGEDGVASHAGGRPSLRVRCGGCTRTYENVNVI